MADNNYCACNSGESKYTIKLNQQGPAGKKGEQGDKGLPGFSPYISVVQSDDENYILRINNEANSYNTPNLFPKDQVTTWTNNIEGQVQQLQADINTKANLTLDNINVANPFNLNGLYINTDPLRGIVRIGDNYGQHIKVDSNGLSIENDNYYNIGISSTSGIIIGYKDKVLFRLKNEAFEYNNETIATQPWVEKQLDGFLTDLPVATTTSLGVVKPDRKTITIADDGALTANYLVPQTYTNNSGLEVNKFLKLTINNNSLQSSNFSSNDLILTYRTTTFENGVQVGDITSESPITTFLKATVDKLGTVKPDGTTVTINSDGVISAVGEVSQQELADGLALKVNLTDYNNRVGSLESTVGEQAQTIATLQENNTKLLELINTLKDRVTALETMIDGGNA